MAAYIYTTDLTETADLADAIPLNAGDQLFIAQGAAIASIGTTASAIVGPGSLSITIAGDVFASYYGVLAIDGGHDTVVTVKPTGTVEAYFGISLRGDSNYVLNAGDISGGVYIEGGLIQNTGNMSDVDMAISLGGTANTLNTVINTGHLFSQLYGIRAGDATDHIVNRGTIAGYVDLGGGDDQLDGAGGLILGGIRLDTGNDTFLGGSGGDSIDGGDGNDDIDGGGGIDTFVYSGISPIVIDLGAGITFDLTFRDILENIENTVGGHGSDRITGSAVGNTLVAGYGSDQISGLDGNDRLFGQEGLDTLTGGNGRDIMAGGPLADRFDFNTIAESKVGIAADIIRDFVHLTDKIDVSTIDANSVAAGNQAFSFLTTQGAAFTGVAGQLHYVFSQGFTYIEGDVNGNKAADFRIALVGFIGLTAADFAL